MLQPAPSVVRNDVVVAAIQKYQRVGGARRDRTADLYNAIVALSQLSYGPMNDALLVGCRKRTKEIILVFSDP